MNILNHMMILASTNYSFKSPVTIQDLQTKIKQIKLQIKELKNFTQHLDFKIQNIENQKVSLTPQTSEDLDTFCTIVKMVYKDYIKNQS